MNLPNLAGLAAAALFGSFGAVWLGLPVPLLTGPALLTTAIALSGFRLDFPVGLRDAVFLLAGVTIGTGVSRESLAAIATWPLAFVLLLAGVVAMMKAGQWLLMRMMQTDAQSALLAATPGHLSFVIALGELSGGDTRRITVVQSVRLLSLTLLVPAAARLAGIETGVGLAPPGVELHEMNLVQTGLCILAGIAIFPVVKAARLPAPVLLAGMIVGAAARLTGYAPGGLSHFIAFPALALIGTLIGARFAGISLTELRQSGLAGIASTAIAAGFTAITAWMAAALVDMPMLHVLVAFAPGGLETMAVLGAAIGANPGFVAAAHVGRLLALSALVPFFLARIPHAAQ